MASTDLGRQCPGCRRSIAPNLYACGMCWRLLPKPFRQAVSTTWMARKYEPGRARDAHETAKAHADAWLVRHYGRHP